ncbi:MAG: glycosyltransferase [bacterium]
MNEPVPGLSLILACYNEAPWLEHSVREIAAILDASGMTYEIIFVDDASTDGTREVIAGIIAARPEGRMKAVWHVCNTGRGRAVFDGMREASGEIVGFIDADLEVHPRYIPACCEAIRRGAQVAVGRRTFAFVARGLWRRFLSRGYSALAHLLLPLGNVRDTESNCKFFLRATALPVLATVEDPAWFWDTESMVRCHLAGLAIVEVPCRYVRNPAKPSTVRIVRDIVQSLAKLVAFRRRLDRSGLLAKRRGAA